ncbi:Uncharacterised protein [Mycobacteroides abscessus subsp. abscessus]|nr:Uncharacterised protein [Mycobacteroides abscessus subsp. abscessus]
MVGFHLVAVVGAVGGAVRDGVDGLQCAQLTGDQALDLRFGGIRRGGGHCHRAEQSQHQCYRAHQGADNPRHPACHLNPPTRSPGHTPKLETS